MSNEPIKTLAFFDLESTGLPVFEGFKTKITELCIVACSIEHIRSTCRSQIPRVLHKLSVCLNPFRMITPKSSDITGLDNFALENERPLDENTAQLLVHFIKQLQQPVCLVAHNGNGFDFPLLHKELARLKVVLPDSLHCLDSLSVFRKIDAQRNIWKSDTPVEVLAAPQEVIIDTNWASSVRPQCPVSGDSTVPKSDCEDSLDTFLKTAWNDDIQTKSATPTAKSKMSMNLVTKIKSDGEDSLDKLLTVAWSDWQTDNETTAHVAQSKMSVCFADESNGDGEDSVDTFLNEAWTDWQTINETTPQRSQSQMSLVAASDSKRKTEFVPMASKRKLFDDPTQITPSPCKKKFRLIDVHERLFGHVPDVSHYAEADAIVLLRCVVAAQDSFLNLVDAESRLFCDAKTFTDRR